MISRQDAKAQGLKRYFTGVACANGHVAERRVSDGKCPECVANRKAKQRRAKGVPVRSVRKVVVEMQKSTERSRIRYLREQAASQGLKRYFTGVACANGHTNGRYVGSGKCVGCDDAKKLRKRRAKGALPNRKGSTAPGVQRAAMKAGLTRYFTNLPCHNGHIAERFTNGGHCVECIRVKPLDQRKKRNRTKERQKSMKKGATRAAALLTETLGVPHVVVETVDPKTGRKDWQPKPKGD